MVTFGVSSGAVAGFALGLTFGLVLTPAMRWLALKTHYVCGVNSVVNEARPPVAYLGGIAIVTAAFAAACVLHLVHVNATGLVRLVTAALPLTAVGLVDDKIVLKPAPKAALEVVCACFGLWILFGELLGVAELFAAVFVTVAMVNAVNFLDCSDAFAPSAVAASLAGIALFGGTDGVTMFVLSGTVIAFIVYNRPPASIYLGDAGSHFLGAVLAFELLYRFAAPQLRADTLVAAAALAGVPLFDLVFTVFMRLRKRRPWWLGSRDHTVFRMRASGLSKGGAALAIFFVQLGLGALGGVVLGKGGVAAALGLVVLVFSAAAAALWLEKHDGDADGPA